MTDDAAETPVCYRHPDRETYVRCGRCERYICPDDMISASVGFQCPECVRDGNKGVREARTVAGAPVRGNTGLLTWSLITVNVVIFLAVQGSDKLLSDFALRPFSLDGDGVAQGGWHRLITAAFTHEQALHIATNMIALWLFGRPLEAILGPVRFLGSYVVCALGGSTLSYLFMSPVDASIGASGAVFGLVGVLVVVDRQLRENPSGVAIYLVIMLAPGFYFSNIDWRGHIGGLLTGALLGALFAYAPKANRVIWQAVGMVGISALLLVAVQLRSSYLEDQLREGRLATAPQVVPSGDNSCGELHGCDSSRSA